MKQIEQEKEAEAEKKRNRLAATAQVSGTLLQNTYDDMFI